MIKLSDKQAEIYQARIAHYERIMPSEPGYLHRTLAFFDAIQRIAA